MRSHKNRAIPIRSHSFPSADLTEMIRVRAYELYEQRGKIDGHAEEDWLQAESEIKAGRRNSAVA